MVGYFTIEQDATNIVHFDSLSQLFFYMIWRDWAVYGHRGPTGYNRLGPNKQCILNTPLWIDYTIDNMNAVPSYAIEISGLPNYQTVLQSLTQSGMIQKINLPFPICSIAICSLPVNPIDWQQNSVIIQLDPNSPLPFSTTWPNPPQSALVRLPNNIPCNHDHGYCVSSPGVAPLGGTCLCYSSFSVNTPISPYLTLSNSGFSSSSVPSSLIMNSCDLDNRQTCSDPTNLLGLTCSNNGACVVAFENQQQTSMCQCGSFPNNCNGPPNTCQELGQLFISNGFISTTQYTECQVPQSGCLYTYVPGVYTRVSSTYSPTDSFGCQQPRMNENVLVDTGRCNFNSQTNSYSCSCNSGRFGTYCEYVSLQGGCFDNSDLLYQQLSVSTGTNSETKCVFNPFLLQFEPISNSAVPNSIIMTYPQIGCQGLICSGRGTCSHQNMDNPQLDVFVASTLAEQNAIQNPATQYTLFDQTRRLFVQSTQSRIQNQQCICPPGYTGAYCQFLDIIGGCGLGISVRSTDSSSPAHCVCPRSPSGQLLVTGTQCNQVICGSHGNLTINTPGVLDLTSPLPHLFILLSLLILVYVIFLIIKELMLLKYVNRLVPMAHYYMLLQLLLPLLIQHLLLVPLFHKVQVQLKMY